MVVALRLFAIASVAPAALGLSQVQKKRAEGIATPAASERTGIVNPFAAIFKTVEDRFTGHGDSEAKAEQGSETSATLEGRSSGHDAQSHEKAAKEQLQANTTTTKTKRSGSHRLADMKSVKAAADFKAAVKEDDALLEKKTDEKNPVFDEMCRGMPDCKLSMCRWLQLSETDTGSGPCNLFEKNLATCRGWVSPESRAADAPAEDIDCAVSLLRTASLGPGAVSDKVAALESCLAEASMEGCPVSATLLFDSIREFKKLQADEVRIAEIHAALAEEMPRARSALATQAGEADEYAALTTIVQRGDNITSKSMLQEIAGARQLLDVLLKVPPAREQLKAALARANKAFETNDLYTVREAIAWLDVALMEGAKTKVDVGPPTQDARNMMVQLELLLKSLQELSTSTRLANVSLQSKTSIHEAAGKLDVALQLTKAANLAPLAMKDAKMLMKQLWEMHAVVTAVEKRTQEGRAVLADDGNKGMQSLNGTIRELNRSLAAAEGLGLADNASVLAAVDVMDSLSYAYAARQKLHQTLEAAQELLLQDGEELDDSKEEAMIDLLTPVISWGKEVGLKNGLPESEEALSHLKHMKSLKLRMRRALAQGNWSLEFKGKLEPAKSALKEALRVERLKNHKFRLNVTAGRDQATSLADSLEALIQARNELHKAELNVNTTISKKKGYAKAADRLNKSIAVAEDLGLDSEAAVAVQKLTRLQAFVDAKEALLQAVAFSAPARPDETVEVNDTITHSYFNRTGLRPKDLGDISNFADDKDDDFDEHVKALDKAIADAAAQGFVDPRLQKRLIRAKAAKAAAEHLKKAVHVGAVAMTFKEGVEQAVVTLTAALIDAEQAGVAVDLAGARKLLKRLEEVEPARAELIGAVLQGNTSVKSELNLARSSVRLHEAIELNDHLKLNKSLSAAHVTSLRVDELNEALLDIKAAIISGEESVKTDVGVEDAIGELGTALQEARQVNLTRDVGTAQDLLTELINMKQIADSVEESLMG